VPNKTSLNLKIHLNEIHGSRFEKTRLIVPRSSVCGCKTAILWKFDEEDVVGDVDGADDKEMMPRNTPGDELQ